MESIQFVTGAIATPNPITLPTWAARLETVVSAEILRPASALANHTQAQIIAGVTDHLDTAIIAGVANHPAADVIAGVANHAAADSATTLGNHSTATIIACITTHPVHTHDIVVGAAAVANAYGATAAGAADFENGAGGGSNIAGAGATGIQNNAAAQAHIATAVNLAHLGGADLVHGAGVAVVHGAGVAVAHVAGAVVEHTGANPVVAATATKITTSTFSLNVNLLVGDILTLNYIAVGERILLV